MAKKVKDQEAAVEADNVAAQPEAAVEAPKLVDLSEIKDAVQKVHDLCLAWKLQNRGHRYNTFVNNLLGMNRAWVKKIAERLVKP